MTSLRDNAMASQTTYPELNKITWKMNCAESWIMNRNHDYHFCSNEILKNSMLRLKTFFMQDIDFSLMDLKL